MSTHREPMIDYALGYLRSGWSVFPLRGKEPRTLHGHLDASTDPVKVEQWWRTWPEANIGAPVPAGLLVLDVDPRNGGDVAALGDLPPTMTAWSGRGDGGRHLYFRRPPGLDLTSTRLPCGVDLKKNGYLVMPPSIHPATGRPYTWHAPSDQAPAHLPPHLREMLRRPVRAVRPTTTGDTPGAADGLLRVVAAATEGGNGGRGRNDTLFWAACRAAEEGRLTAVREELRRAAVTTGLSDREVERTIDSATRSTSGGDVA